MWRHQVAGLADAFRVVAVDLPGHGALAGVPFRLTDATDLVAAVIERLPDGRAVIVGQSLGGYVGMDVAARRPDLVAGLVLACATAEPRSIAVRAPRTVGSYLAVAAADRLRRRANGSDGAGEPAGRDGAAARSDGEAASGDRAEPRRGEAPGDDRAESPATEGWLFRGGTQAIVAALRESFAPRLAAYPGPTLLVNGEDDELFRSGERGFLARAVAGRLHVIPGAGHLVVEEQPDAFNDAVRRFALAVREGAGAGADAGAGPAGGVTGR
jgi:pimeloyl-ACP methyl ester carboxylesterase